MVGDVDYEQAATNLGIRIRLLRRARGLSQEKLAEAIGLHPTHLRRIEHGRTNSSLRLLWAIARALGTTLPDIFTGNDNTELGI